MDKRFRGQTKGFVRFRGQRFRGQEVSWTEVSWTRFRGGFVDRRFRGQEVSWTGFRGQGFVDRRTWHFDKRGFPGTTFIVIIAPDLQQANSI